MRDGIPPALKWLGAFAGMALVVAITVPMAIDAITGSFRIEDPPSVPVIADDDDDADEPQETSAGSVVDGDAIALADLSGRNAAVRQSQEQFVAIGGVENDAVYFAFPLIDGDPMCVAEVTLELNLIQATATVLAVYPADVPGVLDLADGDAIPDEPFLSDEPRAVAETDGSPGVLIWDVTTLHQDWATGGFADDTEPMVLAVRPPEYGDGDLRVQFASVEAGEDAGGRLVWTGVPDCG